MLNILVFKNQFLSVGFEDNLLKIYKINISEPSKTLIVVNMIYLTSPILKSSFYLEKLDLMAAMTGNGTIHIIDHNSKSK